MKKRSFIAKVAIIICMSIAFISGFTMSFDVPVYADSTTDSWTQVTTNAQLVEAFRYYCKSRDLTIDGSVANGVTQFTTKTFNGICNTLGIDVTALQAQIKYQTDGNTGLKFLFSTVGINAYNRIFAQFLQDNNLSVGDSADESNNTVYSGSIFTDADGISCLVWIINNNATNNVDEPNSGILARGNNYKYSSEQLVSLCPSAANTWGVVANVRPNNTTSLDIYERKFRVDTVDGVDKYTYQAVFRNTYNTSCTIYTESTTLYNYRYGYPIIIYNRDNNTYYCGWYQRANLYGSSYTETIVLNDSFTPNSGSTQNATVFLTTNNTVINNNNYEGDTIINNNGTTGDDDDDDNPSGGGGNNNPSPVTPPGTIGGDGSDGTINFPDFNINLPEINWSLGDLSNKFPFSIPFDMIAFLTLLNGEPQAPHITGSIPLTSHYTWNLDLDFSQFDTFAGIMRGLEFVGFMFFLISATINIVRG